MSDALSNAFGDLWSNLYQREREALCVLADVPSYARSLWRDIPAEHRERLVLGGRLAIDLGAACSTTALDAIRRRTNKNA